VLLRGSLLLTNAITADRMPLLFLLVHAKGGKRRGFLFIEHFGGQQQSRFTHRQVKTGEERIAGLLYLDNIHVLSVQIYYIAHKARYTKSRDSCH
jgi:hypothetical protein